MSDEKLIVTKSKLDSLATSISIKSGVQVPMTIAQMKTAVDGIGIITQDENGYIILPTRGGNGYIDVDKWVTGTNYAQDTAVITVNIERPYAFSGAPFKKVVWDYSRSNNINFCPKVFINGKMEAVIFTGFRGSFSSSSPACFDSCTELTTFDAPVSGIQASQFANCSALNTLILRKSNGLVTLAGSTLLDATKFKSGGEGGTIYIPETLYDHLGDGTSLDYKSATNWATYEGYGTITWAKIEESAYESTTWWQ